MDEPKKFFHVYVCKFGHRSLDALRFEKLDKEFCVTCYTDFILNGLPEAKLERADEPERA